MSSAVAMKARKGTPGGGTMPTPPTNPNPYSETLATTLLVAVRITETKPT
jgi:hypothetical protein